MSVTDRHVALWGDALAVMSVVTLGALAWWPTRSVALQVVVSAGCIIAIAGRVAWGLRRAGRQRREIAEAAGT